MKEQWDELKAWRLVNTMAQQMSGSVEDAREQLREAARLTRKFGAPGSEEYAEEYELVVELTKPVYGG